MKQLSSLKLKTFVVIAISLFSFSVSNGQSEELKKDLINKSVADGASATFGNYLKAIPANGNKATKQVNLPVDKLKEIVDACSKYGVTNISAVFVWINTGTEKFARGSDNKQAPSGYQSLVIKVPASAFPGQAAAKINSTGSPLMLSLLSAGLVLLDPAETGLPGTGDLYFAIGTICPPPASCD